MAETPEGEFPGAIGIDLGTTYSCVAVYRNEHVEILANDQGNRTTPSYVAFNEEERVIGDAAKNQAAMNPENTVFDAKRLIGRRFDDPDVKKDMKHWPFKVIDNGGAPVIEVNFRGTEQRFTPQEISAMVLSKMKDIAEAKIGMTVKKAVVTVPAYFNDAQRHSTQDAGAIAGLQVLRIINEPTAAAMAYGLQEENIKDAKEKLVLIFDLGGGTFDVSLLKLDKGFFNVKATAGDTHLGGEDFDQALLEHLVEKFKEKTGQDINGNARALRRLRSACERAKRTLSSVTSATIEVDSLSEGEDFSINITRALFERINSAAFQKTLEPVERVLKDAKIAQDKVDEIVLVGGSTRIPKIQSIVSDFFGGRKLNKSVNPDEAVAHGAAIQAAILTNQHKSDTEILLLDVIPLSLGVGMQGDIFAAVVPRNTSIPTTMKRSFTTVEDNQTVVTFPVYEGERTQCKDNRLLGEFELNHIPPMPRGQASLIATFNIDANGILKVTAEESTSKAQASITITNSVGRLSNAEIEQALADAESNKAADKDMSKRQETKNQLVEQIAKAELLLQNPEISERFLRPLLDSAKVLVDSKLVDVTYEELNSANVGIKRAITKSQPKRR